MATQNQQQRKASATNVANKVRTSLYTAFVGMLEPAVAAERTIEQGKKARDGAYSQGITAVAKALKTVKGNRERAWELVSEAFSILETNIRANADGLADKIGAPKKKEPDQDGNTHNVPSAVKAVKSEIKYAFEHWDGKASSNPFVDGEGEPVSFGTLRSGNSKLRAAVREKEKKRAEAQRIAGLKGDDKLRHQLSLALTAIMKAGESLTGKELKALLRNVEKIAPTTSEAPKDESDEKPSAGETLSEAA